MSDAIDEFTDAHVETGFVTAAVNPDELTPEGVQAAKALVQLPEVSPVELAQIAREVAYDVAELPSILQKHKLTKPQYEFLEKHNRFFRETLKQASKDLQGVKSTEARLRLQAQAALEQQLPVIASRMGNAAEKLGDVVEAFKAVARVAGVDTPPAGPVGTGERYQIVIDLGADANLVIAAKGRAPAGGVAPPDAALSPDGQGAGEPRPVRRDGEGARNLLALPAFPEG